MVTFSPAMRALIIAAHPDDETIGLGGQIHRFRDPFFVHLTDGAPQGSPPDYAATRRAELEAALDIAGFRGRSIRLGFTDQGCWSTVAEIASELRRVIAGLRPSAIYTHPYEGGHPDHDSAAFAVQAAAGAVPRFEFTSYHNSPAGIKTGAFLPGAEHVPCAFVLSEADRERKRRMFVCFASQRDMLKNFAIGVELVRRAPVYDFERRPHEGVLYYETQPWGVRK